ncbi:hypothetical protein PNA2_0148 [Pyrococcus sp. NA2]|uniref:hypothetical protein n=1 Tax=Pyrococcus sp. (strain NA2) TaxID=342949 RepID=UPI000209AEC6|nr:hypothetical protein [Pyrococcus sp. NA2]AEC51067.1 hypothetical protein PNA2_0148 [Pyrococcus sp. NA2]
MKHKKVVMLSMFVVFLGLITAIHYGRVDHIYRTSVALFGLSIPFWLPGIYKPKGIIRKALEPIYNWEVMAILAIFIAIHVSLVNVPFTTIDLFHKEWRDADIISHFLGGLTIWLILYTVLREFRIPKKAILMYSIIMFYVLAIGWEIAEKLSEGEITFITETFQNKVRDVISDSLGMITGIIWKRREITSYQQS